MKSISGYIVDILGKKVFPGTIYFDKYIQRIEESEKAEGRFILPGFIDSHVHIESSMLVPAEFARLAVVHGTVATISDPHEIGNVMGIDGVQYMIENGEQVPFKFYFGAPSCVPATSFETAGAEISADEIDILLRDDRVKYLAEMMNWPGVLNGDKTVAEKIQIAKSYGKPVDGHAPGLKGKSAEKYASAGITTDHESFTLEEAKDKLKAGMKILIREGSAAKNFDALISLLEDNENDIMFCSDDKHPDNLVEGHINQHVKRAIAKGIDVFKVLKAACINPVLHYNMETGMIKESDPADFIVVDNLKEFNVLETYIDGQLVAKNGKTFITPAKNKIINNFNTGFKTSNDFDLAWEKATIPVIEPEDGQLITQQFEYTPRKVNGLIQTDPENDILIIAVVNRYQDAKPAVALIKNFGLKKGAIASSVAHDSHNIIVVGVDDESIAKATNLIISAKGGISAVYEEQSHLLPLPVAGIMSAEDGYEVAKKYAEIDKVAKLMGSKLTSPFMTLSFMALLVIPKLKLSDKGLFDGEKFEFIK